MTVNLQTLRTTDTGEPTDLRTAVQGFLLSREWEQCSPRTVQFYRQQLSWFQRFLQPEVRRVGDVTKQHVGAYLLDLQHRPKQRPRPGHEKMSPQTVRGAHRALRAFFRWCVREEYLRADPMVNIKLPRVPKIPKGFLPDNALDLYLKHCPTITFSDVRNAAIVTLYWTTGMRRQEMWSLKQEWLEWDKNRIYVIGKRQKQRYVPFLPQAKKAVWRYLTWRKDDRSELWLTEERTPLSLEGLDTAMWNLRDAVGSTVPDIQHAFRRTWAVRQILTAKVDINTVRIVGGWEDLKTLQGYIEAITGEQAIQAGNWK